jgi:hypothetical protein
MAMRAGPEDLKPFYGPARGFSFAREVQPILGRHCVSCHDGEDELDLTARPVPDAASKRAWSIAYLALTGANVDGRRKAYAGQPDGPHVKWPGAQSVPTMLPPYFAGSATSPLLELLRAGHYEVQLSREEYEKLACWVDLAVPFCGDYREANLWNEKDREKYDHYEAKRHRLAEEELASIRQWVDYLATGQHAASPAKLIN